MSMLHTSTIVAPSTVRAFTLLLKRYPIFGEDLIGI